MTPIADPVLVNDWHPVLASEHLQQQPVQVELLGLRLVLWRDSSGQPHALDDRCTHRGAALSLGRIVDDRLHCPYHGWQFGKTGRCEKRPACPEHEPPVRADVRSHPVQEAYGLLWVCAGQPAHALPLFPEAGDARLRHVVCGPYEVRSGGPRIVENFLDMAHFGFVHGGILGDPDHPVVPDYRVETLDCPSRGQGLIALGCRAWQPRANLALAGAGTAAGSWVDYSYRVVRPLSAILTKKPEAMHADYEEAIGLFIQPVQALHCRVWVVLALDLHDQSDEALRQFQDTIFLQDLPIVESQQPSELPLQPGAELGQPCDRLSAAYRQYLLRIGLQTGVLR